MSRVVQYTDNHAYGWKAYRSDGSFRLFMVPATPRARTMTAKAAWDRIYQRAWDKARQDAQTWAAGG